MLSLRLELSEIDSGNVVQERLEFRFNQAKVVLVKETCDSRMLLAEFRG